MKKPNKYWAKRYKLEQEAIKKYISQDAEAINSLGQHYDAMIANIDNLINAEISRLATRNNVGLELARQQVTDMDVAAYQEKAKAIVKKAEQMRKKGHHVSYSDYPEAVNQELRVYNATMRINRLELLKANIFLEIQRAGLAVATDTQKTLVDRYVSEVKRQSGILGISSKNDELLNNAAIQGVVNADVNGANWSSRLWANQVGLRANVEQVLSTGLAFFDAKKMRNLMQSNVNNWKYVASRLINTEISRVLYLAQWGSIKKAGYRFVQWINEPKACTICSAISRQNNGFGKGIYEYDKVPSIPADTHPNCRCAISAYYIDGESNDIKDAGKAKGTTSNILQDMLDKLASPPPKSSSSDDPKSKLTDDEIWAMNNYVNSASYPLNEALRNNSEMTSLQQKMVKNIDSALDKLPVYKSNKPLYRSFSDSFGNADELNKLILDVVEKGIYIDKGYISTAKTVFDPGDYLRLIIKNSYSGRDISSIREDENEVLFKRNTAFKVLGRYNKEGKTFIEVEEFEPKGR